MKKKDSQVVIVENLFAEDNPVFADTLRAVTGSEHPRFLLVADANVVQRNAGLGTAIGKYVQANGLELAGRSVVLAGGEKIKNDGFASFRQVAEAQLSARLGPNDVVLAIGGGTVLDVAGYAGVQVRGGVKLVRVPTTVAAIVDAAFSERCALDGLGVKDALSVAAPPAAVLADLALVNTVLDGVWSAGFAEMLRLAVAHDAKLVRLLAESAAAYRGRDAKLLAELVTATLAVRAKKGGSDFALWCALRLEAMSGYKLPHGYAVALGIGVDLAYAQLMGLMAEEDVNLVARSLVECGAMEGAVHSSHLLQRADEVLHGLDAWALAHASEEIVLPQALGKSAAVPQIDRETMKRALNMVKYTL